MSDGPPSHWELSLRSGLLGDFTVGADGPRLRVNVDAHVSANTKLTLTLDHEMAHRSRVLGTGYGLVQTYLAIASNAPDQGVLLGFGSAPLDARRLFEQSWMTHEGYAVAVERAHGEVHGVPILQLPPRYEEAWSYYSHLLSCLPGGYQYFAPSLLMAVSEYCLGMQAVPEWDPDQGLTEDLVRRLITDERHHPDARLIELVMDWDERPPDAAIAKAIETLVESIQAHFKCTTAEVAELMRAVSGPGPTTESARVLGDLGCKVTDYFMRLLCLLSPLGTADAGLEARNRFAQATADRFRSNGVLCEPILSVLPAEYMSTTAALGAFDVHYERERHFVDIGMEFGGMETWHALVKSMGWEAAICWVEPTFIVVVPLLPGPREPSPVDLLEIMNGSRTTPVDESVRRMHVAGIRVIVVGGGLDFLEEMGDFCVAIATTDPLRGESVERWTLGAHLAQTFPDKAGVAVIDPAPMGVYGALKMFREANVTEVRRVAGHVDTEYWLVRMHGIQVLLEVQTNLRGVLGQQEELGNWLASSFMDATATTDDADAWGSAVASLAALNGFAPPETGRDEPR